jgi:hypothetical protein
MKRRLAHDFLAVRSCRKPAPDGQASASPRVDRRGTPPQLDAICASNPEGVKRIRDTSANDMAAVGAIKTLEAMRVDVVTETGGKPGASQPGLQIVIDTIGGESRVVCGPPERPTPMIEATAVEQGTD